MELSVNQLGHNLKMSNNKRYNRKFYRKPSAQTMNARAEEYATKYSKEITRLEEILAGSAGNHRSGFVFDMYSILKTGKRPFTEKMHADVYGRSQVTCTKVTKRRVRKLPSDVCVLSPLVCVPHVCECSPERDLRFGLLRNGPPPVPSCPLRTLHYSGFCEPAPLLVWTFCSCVTL